MWYVLLDINENIVDCIEINAKTMSSAKRTVTKQMKAKHYWPVYHSRSGKWHFSKNNRHSVLQNRWRRLFDNGQIVSPKYLSPVIVEKHSLELEQVIQKLRKSV